jgi:predicted nucleotide-binding protein
MPKKNQPNRSGPLDSIDPQLAHSRLTALVQKIYLFRGQTTDFPEFQAWLADVKIALSRFYGQESEEYARFKSIWFTTGSFYPGQPKAEIVEAFDSGIEQARLFLNSRIEDWSLAAVPAPKTRDQLIVNRKDVFVVHGHNHGMKETVARLLSKLGLNPIILHEQADEGNTIIEKFEKHANVSFAVAVFSGDDLAVAKRDTSATKRVEESLRVRARQNVVLEFGYFLGALGRRNVVAVVEEGVETPSDYSGVLYIPFDANDGWRLRLVKELKAAGLDVDANAAF